MKISIKLKPDEVRALVGVFERAIVTDGNITTRHDAIVQVMMVRMYADLKRRSVLMDKPVKITVPVDTAMAFCEYFESIPYDRTSFSGFVLFKTLNHFNQQTAGMYYY